MNVLTRIEIFEQFVKIHLSEYSVRYNRENIVGSPGKYRIIDFHAIDGHDCLWSKFCKEQDLLSYNERTFPCESLTLAGRDLEIWEKCMDLYLYIKTNKLITPN